MDIVIQFSFVIISSALLAAYYLRLSGINAYTRKFAFTVVSISFIMVAILDSVGGSIAISISLFGALSLLRFRTIVRDTDDMAFLFVSLALGLAAGTSNFLIAILLLLSFGILLFFFNMFEKHEVDRNIMYIDINAKGDVDTMSLIESIRQFGIQGLSLVSISEDTDKSLNRYRFKCNQTECQAITTLGLITALPGVIRCRLVSNDAPTNI